MQKLLLALILIHSLLVIRSAPYVESIASIGILHCRVDELLYVDLASYVTGYNVTHQLKTPSEFISIFPNIINAASYQLLNNQSSPPQVVSRFIPRDNLGYINRYEPLLFLTNKLHVYYTTFNNTKDLHTEFLVTDAQGASCFGVTYISGLIIADCLINDGQQQTNQFYLFNASDHADSSSIPSTPTCKTKISNRTARGIKTFKFSNNLIYVFRYQYASASLDCNTEGLVEIWQLDSKYNMTLLCTIRGTLFGEDLELSGFEVYLGDLFLLTRRGALFRLFNYYAGLRSIEYLELRIPLTLKDEPLQSVKVFPESKNQARQLTVAIASLAYIYLADWAEPENPLVRSRYKLDGPKVVKSITFSKGFIYCLVSYDNINEKVVIFQRGKHLDNLIFGYIDITDSNNSYIDADIATDSLVISSGNYIRRYSCQDPYLWFKRPKASFKGEIVIRSTSYSGNESMTLETPVPYEVVSTSDMSIYFDKPHLPRLIHAEYPSMIQVHIDQYVTGPFVKFKVSDSLSNKTKASLKYYVPVGYNLHGFDTTDIIYHKIFPATRDKNLWLFIQNKTFHLTSFACLLEFSMNLNCKPHASILLDNSIEKLEVIDNYIFVLFEDRRLHLLSFMMEIVDPDLADDCADIIPFVQKEANMLICPQPVLNRFAYFLFTEGGLKELQFIDQSHFRTPVVLLSIVFVPWFPTVLFINNNNTEVLVINAEMLAGYNNITLVDRITPEQTPEGSFKELRFTIVQESLIFFSDNNASLIQEWNLGISEASFVKTYKRLPDINFNLNSQNSMYSSAFLPNYYISAYDRNKVPQITIFSGNLPGNDNFVTKIRFEEFEPGAEIFLSGAPLNEMNSDLIIASTATGIRAFVVYSHARLTFSSFISNSSAPQETTSFQLEIFNDMDVPQFNLTFELITFNTQLEIVKTTKNIIITDLIEIDINTKNQAFVLPNDKYFNGTILYYDFQAQQKIDMDSIYLKTKIALNGTFWSKEYPIRDMKKGENSIIMQAERGLIRVDTITQKNCTIMPLELADASCMLVVIDKQREFGLSLCYFTENITQYIYLIGIQSSVDCNYTVFLEPTKTSLVSAESMKLKEGGLFILEKQVGYDSIAYARIHVWDFTNMSDPYYYGYVDQINFNVNYIDIRAFDIAISGETWILFTIDAAFGIRIIRITDRGFSDPFGIRLADHAEFEKLRIPADIEWTGIAVIQQKNEKTFDLLIIAKNFNSYYVRMTQTGEAEWSLKVIRGYYRYPGFNHGSKISVNVDSQWAYFAINAMQVVEGRSIVLLYNITDVVRIGMEDQFPPFKYEDFIDYTPFREDNRSANAFVVTSIKPFENSTSQTWIWASAPSKANNLGIYERGAVEASYCAYEVNADAQIVIQSADIHSTTLRLEVGNDVGSKAIDIKINNSMMNLRARRWAYILTGILFLVALLIFVGTKWIFPKDNHQSRSNKYSIMIEE